MSHIREVVIKVIYMYIYIYILYIYIIYIYIYYICYIYTIYLVYLGIYLVYISILCIVKQLFAIVYTWVTPSKTCHTLLKGYYSNAILLTTSNYIMASLLIDFILSSVSSLCWWYISIFGDLLLCFFYNLHRFHNLNNNLFNNLTTYFN